jgi:hypothetical protein
MKPMETDAFDSGKVEPEKTKMIETKVSKVLTDHEDENLVLRVTKEKIHGVLL